MLVQTQNSISVTDWLTRLGEQMDPQAPFNDDGAGAIPGGAGGASSGGSSSPPWSFPDPPQDRPRARRETSNILQDENLECVLPGLQPVAEDSSSDTSGGALQQSRLPRPQQLGGGRGGVRGVPSVRFLLQTGDGTPTSRFVSIQEALDEGLSHYDILGRLPQSTIQVPQSMAGNVR